MKIEKYSVFLDGKTIQVITNKGTFSFDNRIHSATPGRLYKGFPKDDNSNLIENYDELEKEIIEALKLYHDDFYQSSIEHFINSKQK